MHGDKSVYFDFWNSTDTSTFLAGDRTNPARALVAEIIKKDIPRRCRPPRTLLEIGCGPGFDYVDHFSKIKGLRYLGLDGSPAMVERCQTLASNLPRGAAPHRFSVGTFEDIGESEYDYTYCRAVLEHQRSYEDGLAALCVATRRKCFVCWYLPPGEKAELRFNPKVPMYTNRYKRMDVEKSVEQLGYSLTVSTVEGSPNELWVLTPSSEATTVETSPFRKGF